MSQSLAMQEATTSLELEHKVEGVWKALEEGRKVRVVISADSKILNPFSTLRIRFEDGERELATLETLLKCDVLGSCRYCFTRDYSHFVLIRNRVEKLLPTVWDGVLNWQGVPVFEDEYWESVEVRDGLVVFRKEGRMSLYKYKALEVEEREGLFRVSILEENKLIRYYTERLELKV